MRARITYHPDYNGREGYTVEILTPDGWGLDTFFPLVERKGNLKDEDKNFVHFSMINKISELIEFGYKITFR